MKIGLRLIRARPSFYLISDNSNVSFRIVVFLLYNCRIALKGDYHKKRMNMLEYRPVEYNQLENLAKFFIIPTRENQFFQENNFNNAPVRRFANAMKRNSEFTGFYTEIPFLYQLFHLRKIRILRGGQPIVDFDAADKICLYIATMNAINIQDDCPSTSIDIFKDHYVLLFDFTSVQEATESCHQPELVVAPLRLELNFNFSSRTRDWSSSIRATNVFGCR